MLEDYVERVRTVVDGHHRPAGGDRAPSQLPRGLRRPAFKFGSYATSTQAIAIADLVVNATPLGMRADDPAPFDTALLRPGQRAFDVVYGHGETAFVAGARDAGCTAVDGAGMLVAQAVASVRIVCDIADVEVDLDAVDLFAVMADAAGF